MSELKKPRPHGAVVQWLNRQQDQHLFTSAVTLGEIQSGIERTRRQDPAKADDIQSWLDDVERSFQVLPMDSSCFREWARLMHSAPNELLEDAMIAATARVRGLIVVTRNERDFRHFDVEILNPFKA